eukprot:TRINITY_DN3157_c0_g1_i1.p1 TRINITY_DN3157_c0_g1~~TRINITY_DN3157_c0_g1_i1.p1  ORF type:complete len:321 (-),score=64.96 TRINITY_DN3157_c0_g1_i1:118-1080(-)
MDQAKLNEWAPERAFVRRINEIIDDGGDHAGNPLPKQFIFPYTQDPFGAPGTRTIVSAMLLSQFRSITHLCFYRAHVGDEGVDALCELLRNSDMPLKNLELVDNNITALGCKYLSFALKPNKHLLTLVLDHNNFGDDGIEALFGHGLSANEKLQCLSAKYCGLGVKGARVVANRIIPTVKGLTKLVLAGNEIGNEGALAIAIALRPILNLKTVDLSNCCFGDDPALLQQFKDAIAINTSVNNLNLSGNLFPRESGPLFVDLLKVNKNLTDIGSQGGLHSTRIDSGTFKELKKQKDVNKKNYAKRLKKGKKKGKGKGKKKA